MKEYIERTVALDVVKRTSGDYAAAWSEIAHMPAADVAEVRHGRWEEADWVEIEVHGLETTQIPKAGLRCSRCSDVFDKELLWTDNYCPNCGALMKESEHEAN